MIYFHGNAEDVGSCDTLMRALSRSLQAHIISVEYKGYGIYKGSPSAESIIQDSQRVYDFVTKALNW